ncbi:MAG: succinyl-CoA--3-ketoacid-CoA transferase [Dehalococcoidia bacterium]|nr:succinyl-CoA--3-ketoacid-CoA transferase [Dehalococcoidia bacterium]
MIALRASKEIRDGTYVNLGIGGGGLVSNWIQGRDVILQAEIGMLKTGPLATGDQIDQDLINASCEPVTELPGASYFDIVESMAMIRGGHIDLAILGAFQVSERGDFASWLNPARGYPRGVGNIGGSMDLAVGAKRIIITMEHTANGKPKIVKQCTYPLTARGVVNLIITNLAVIEVTPRGLVLKEAYPGLTPEDIQSVTEPRLIIAPDFKEIEL